MRPKASLLSALLIVSGVACGSGDASIVDDAGDRVGSDESTTGAQTETPNGGETFTAGIRAASLLDPGTIDVEVEGNSYRFRRDDSDQVDWDCEVSDDRVELVFQSSTNDHSMTFEYSDAERVGGAAGQFLGRVTIAPRELGPAGFAGADPGIDAATISREAPYAFVVLDAIRFESTADLEPVDAGPMIIRANCEEGSSSTDGTAGAGSDATPEGRRVTVEFPTEDRTYTFDESMRNFLCATVAGLGRAAGETDDGLVRFQALAYVPGEGPDTPDAPHILIEDQQSGISYVAGQAPGSGIDRGGSALYSVSVTEDGFEATGGFIEVGGSPTELIPGTIRASCS